MTHHFIIEHDVFVSRFPVTARVGANRCQIIGRINMLRLCLEEVEGMGERG